jgi:uncharacterized peroxidase-related enzyme
MTRIPALDPAQAPDRSKPMLANVQKALGITPNLMKALANSPAALDGYLKLDSALSHGVLNGQLRERLSLTVAQANSCDYCLSAHTAIGQGAGLAADELAAARKGDSADAKIAAGLHFAQEVNNQRGQVSDDAVATVRAAGYNDAEIAELVANVALNVLTNYFNNVAQTDIDFPVVHA